MMCLTSVLFSKGKEPHTEQMSKQFGYCNTGNQMECKVKHHILCTVTSTEPHWYHDSIDALVDCIEGHRTGTASERVCMGRFWARLDFGSTAGYE